MGITDDVLVVGGGLAGMTAALAASESGASVRLVTDSESTLQQASGLVDVLGYPNPHDGDGDDSGENAEAASPVPNPFDAIESLPADHPYRVVGEGSLRGGLAAFDDATGDLYVGEHTDANALVPTVGGTVKPTARYPASVAAGLASDTRSMAVVGFKGDTDTDAERIAAHLEAAGVPFEVTGVTVEFPGDLDGTDQDTRLAHALDEDEGSGRRVLANRVSRALDDADGLGVDDVDRVGFPAVLGRDRPREIRSALADGLDADVFEVPPAPPSLPGLRLRYRFRDALREAGVALTTGNPVVDHDVEDGRIETVYADRNASRVPYEPQAVVLATGGLVGGGIDSERDRVYEPVFDCHVPHSTDRYDWSDADTFGPHAFARFGVRIDGDARVLDADGDPTYENLTAAGGVVGGYDPATEKSASGVSLATGYAAGRSAAAAVTDSQQPPLTEKR